MWFSKTLSVAANMSRNLWACYFRQSFHFLKIPGAGFRSSGLLQDFSEPIDVGGEDDLALLHRMFGRSFICFQASMVTDRVEYHRQWKAKRGFSGIRPISDCPNGDASDDLSSLTGIEIFIALGVGIWRGRLLHPRTKTNLKEDFKTVA